MNLSTQRAGAFLRAGAIALAVVAMGACSSGPDDQSGAGSGSASGKAVQTAAALAGTQWQAVEIEGIAPTLSVVSTLAFVPPGRASGGAGCNRFSAPATVGDGTVHFGPMITTRMACPPPQMEQEALYLAALAKAERWRIGGDGRLTLADAAGSALVVFSREQP